jgi:hypothetical protein
VKTVKEKSRGESTLPDSPVWWQIVQRPVMSLRYGNLQIVIHDSRVVQIERNQKFCIDEGVAGLI